MLEDYWGELDFLAKDGLDTINVGSKDIFWLWLRLDEVANAWAKSLFFFAVTPDVVPKYPLFSKEALLLRLKPLMLELATWGIWGGYAGCCPNEKPRLVLC